MTLTEKKRKKWHKETKTKRETQILISLLKICYLKIILYVMPSFSYFKNKKISTNGKKNVEVKETLKHKI